MTIEQLKEQMQQGVVAFKFQKKDGSIREANGTTNMGMIPEENHPVGNTFTNEETVRYFDTDKQAWRSFRKELFIEE